MPPAFSELTERETELRRLEDELGSAEEKLQSECGQLDSAAGAILARLQTARAAATHLAGKGLKEKDFLDVHQRVTGGSLPRLDASGARSQALTARHAAVEARRSAVESIRRQVHDFASELSRLSSQLTADEAALQRYERLTRERDEAARKAAQAQATEAQAQAQATQAATPPKLAPLSGGAMALTQPATPPPPPTRPEGRRGQPRVRMQAQVDLESESNFFAGFSTNISEGGLFVATVQAVPLGTQVDLHFTLPDGTRVDVQGEVRWLREVNDKTPEIFPGLGVQFRGLTPQAAEAIRTFVSSREPLFFPD